VIASHDGAHLQTSQQGTNWDDASQNANCPAGDLERIDEGEVLWHFVLTDPAGDSATLTATFDTDGDGVADLTVNQASEPREGNGALHFYVVTGEARLITASTDIAGGNLVLSHICNEIGVASISVDKTGPAQSKVGDPTGYTVTIINDGGRALTITSVIDSLAGDLTAAVAGQCGQLAVDEICTYNYSYTPVEGDPDQLVNTVTVTATPLSGSAVTDSDSVTVDLFQPSISVEKTGPATAEVGEEITYTVTITNTSSSDSPNLVFELVSDTLAGDLTAAVVAQCDELEPAEVCAFDYTYTVSDTDADPLDNTVTVQTHPDGFPNDIDGSDSHQVDLLMPSIEVVKSGPPQSKIGDPTDYTITITNTGELALTLTAVDDSLAGDLTAEVVAECGELAAGAECVFEYTYTPVDGDPDQLVNTVTVTASTASGTSVNGTDSVTVDLFQPSIEVTKVADVETAQVGDTVTYTVTIENTSSSDSPDLDLTLIDDSLEGDMLAECPDLLAAGAVCEFDYTHVVTAEDANPLVNTISVESNPVGFPNDIDDSDSAEVVITADEVLGSITINKVIDCEECETRTIGYWFNTAGSHDDETNALLAELAALDGGDPLLVEVDIDGTVHTFGNAQDVRDFVKADQQGDDGEPGLSRDGQLLRQYLATQLNVLLNGDECDLGSRMLGDQTVSEILLEAEAALAADDEAAEVAAIEKLTAINESDDADENPLTCGEGTEGTSVDDFHFDLYAEADYPDGDPMDSGTTANGGTLTFDNLPLGTYVIVETGNDLGLECEITSVSEGGTLNADGSITVTIDETNPDVTITVTNDCEQTGEEEEFGEIEIVKEANDSDEPFGFSATWENGEFTLMDGESEFSGDLLAGESFTVTEELTAEQIAAGWSLLDIDCGEADVEVDGASVTITVVANTTITCTFTNELEEDEEEGELEIIKIFCPTVGTDAIFVFGPLTEEPVEMSLQQLDEDDELPSDEGCTLGAPSEDALGATFTITGGDLMEPMVVMTAWDEILTLELAPGDYTIVEEGTGLTTDFTVLADGDTAVVVFNYGEEEEENGRLKVLKFYCVGEGDPVFTAVDGDAGIADVTLPANCESPEPGDADFTLTTGELTSGVFDLGDDGARLIPLPAGTYVLNEVDPNDASSDEFAVTAGETTTVIVFNFEAEGEEPNEGTQGGNPQPNEGTLGGNPLPNTAISPTPNGSVPAALLAMLMLSGLGAAAYAVKAEVRRRR
jgi:uncharacterized repeat protein (TIGR01451 family)